MAQAKLNKSYRTFVKGLITEASPLTYPDDSSYAELNTILSRKGSRSRRLGQSYAGMPRVASLEVVDLNHAHQEFVWKAVGNLANTNFLVIRKAKMVHFFDMAPALTTTAQKSFSVDLSVYARPGASEVEINEDDIQFAFGKGLLFIAGDKIEPLYIKYLKDTDDIEVTPITILIRDYDGLNDGLANDQEPSSLTKEHHYNLQNQGWVDGSGSASSTTFTPVAFDGYTFEDEIDTFDRWNNTPVTTYQQGSTTSSPIFKYQQVLGRYPGNNKQWWVARAEADDPDKGIKAGDFLPDVLNRLYSGNNRAPNGHYVLNAFKRDRSAVSGVSNIEVEEIEGRPNSIAFYSGRAWYGQGSTIYFSQILDGLGGYKAGLCYQEADPTAEDISDLIQSDGGVIPIPEIDKIIRLVPIANGIAVFAMNGVWFINGGGDGFSATSLAVSKISSTGTKNPYAILDVDEMIFWWSETGIQAMQQASGQYGPIPGKFGNSNISEQTIQSLYNSIEEVDKEKAKALYDSRNNTIYWLYNSGELEGKFEYDSILLFDLTLQAFFTWKFSSIENGPIVNGFYLDTGYSSAIGTEDVVAGADLVVTEAAEQVTSSNEVAISRPSNVMYTVNVPSEGMTISQTEEASCADWVSFDNVGVPYDSYIETGFEVHEDTMRNKQVVYLSTHLTQRDNTSCVFQSKWDWGSSNYSNKWGTQFETYRPRSRINTLQDQDAFYVVTSKNKVRGHGKAIQFRFGTSEIGKNFDLLGWSVTFSGNTQP